MDERAGRVLRLITDEPVRGGDGDGVTGVLRRLCSAAERALSAQGVGVSVGAEAGVPGVAAVSGPACRALEELQFTLGEGPCLEAFNRRRPVLVPDLADESPGRWPAYLPALHEQGVQAVFAFPLQIGAARLGTLDIFRGRPGS
ncbi:GAF domain-containing protein [Paractinoplanes durhamensis]